MAGNCKLWGRGTGEWYPFARLYRIKVELFLDDKLIETSYPAGLIFRGPDPFPRRQHARMSR